MDDQECIFTSRDQKATTVDDEEYSDGRDPLAPWDPSGIDLEEELAKLRQRSSEPVYVPDEEKPPHDEGLPDGPSSPSDGGGRGSSTDKPGSDSKPKPSTSSHDPFIMPDGKPVPEGYNWDGNRLVCNKKGSKRPPDTSSEEWRNMSAISVRRISKGIKLSLSGRQPLVLRKKGTQPELCQHSSV